MACYCNSIQNLHVHTCRYRHTILYNYVFTRTNIVFILVLPVNSRTLWSASIWLPAFAMPKGTEGDAKGNNRRLGARKTLNPPKP